MLLPGRGAEPPTNFVIILADDLAADPGETNNLAMQHPEIVAWLTTVVRDFDAALQRDKLPMQFEPGIPLPALHSVRTAETDLTPHRFP